jgi:hypothetical protein
MARPPILAYFPEFIRRDRFIPELLVIFSSNPRLSFPSESYSLEFSVILYEFPLSISFMYLLYRMYHDNVPAANRIDITGIAQSA